ncbi:MAG: hypothetical protein AAB897_03490 [Patescibacteria group bacterium]
MANLGLNARKAMEREGDPDSGRNLKLRRHAAVIAKAILRRVYLNGSRVLDLPRGYAIERTMSGRNRLVRPGHRVYYVEGERGTASLAGAKEMAISVACGWLHEVYSWIVSEFGQDAANKFAQDLQM